MISALTHLQSDWLRELFFLFLGDFSGQQIPADKLFQDFCRKKRLNSSNRRQLANAFFGFLRCYWSVRRIAASNDVSDLFSAWLSLLNSNASSSSMVGPCRGSLPALQPCADSDYDGSSSPLALSGTHNLFGAHKEFPEIVASLDLSSPEIRANLSPDLWRLFRDSFPSPDVALEEALAFHQPAPCDLRINTFAGFSKSFVLRNLCAEGIITDELPLDGLRLLSRPALKNLSMYRYGAFEVQDFGSQIVSHLCPVQSNMRILDYCAGGGGKTLALLNALAEEGTFKGSIVVTDVDSCRLNRARQRFARIRNFPKNSVHLVDFPSLQEGSSLDLFDLVVVDAPCSGLGTLRRNPDKSIFLTAESIVQYAETQKTVLEAALKWVRPGGVLAYITCSVLKAENESVVGAVLAQHSNLTPRVIRWTERLRTLSPARLSPLGLQLSPRSTHTDGLFLALLEKS